MENCFVTKFKGTVENDNLPVFNALCIKVDAANDSSLAARSIQLYIQADTYHVKCTGAGTFTTDSTGASGFVNEGNITNTGGLDLVFSPGKYYVYISSKYNITGIAQLNSVAAKEQKAFTIDVTQFKFNPTFGNCFIDGFKLEGEWGSNLNPRSFNCYSSAEVQYAAQYDNAQLDLSIFANKTSLKRFAKQNAIVGSIENFGGCIDLEYISIRCATVTGEIDNLAAAMVANGRTSGTLSLEVTESNITDEGHKVTHDYLVSKGGSWIVSIDFSGSGYTKRY